VLLPLARGDVLLGVAVEEEQAHLVVVLDRGEGEQRGQLGGGLALGAPARAEVLRRADVHHQEHGQLALLVVALDERDAHPGGHVPVDRADVVARHIGPDLVELHAAPAEDREVGAREDVRHLAAGLDLDASDLVDDLRREHATGLPRSPGSR
jgi:hypothetical protein